MKRLFASLFFLSAAVSPATADDPLIRNIVDCKPDFFELLKQKRAAIGPVTIRSTDEPDMKLRKVTDIATFATPIHDFGLTFTRYRQEKASGDLNSAAHYTKWHWGFEANADPDTVALALHSYVKKRGTAFGKRGFEYIQESGIWSVGIGTDKERATNSGTNKIYDPWRQLVVLPIDGGERSYLACVSSKRIEMIRPDYDDGRLSINLPDIRSLFEQVSR